MKKSASLVLTFLLLAQSFVFALPHQETMPRLTNKQIVEMVRAGLSPEVIISKIKTSRCNFDTDPSLLAEMKHNGVPNEVLQAMIEAPYGPPKQIPARTADAPSRMPEPIELKKEVQPQNNLSGQEAKVGDLVGFGKPRVFITDSNSWTTSRGSGGARPQTAEIIKTFGERCSDCVVTLKQEKADYIVLLEHEGGKGIARKDNKFAVFNIDGDAVKSGSTRSLGNAVKDACEALMENWKSRTSRAAPKTNRP